ncbi:MAG: hypothetical protein QM703_08845 [Gemmatales bacterium]
MQRWLTRLNRNDLLMTGVVAATLLAVFLVLNHGPLWHTDVWAHLKYGTWIVEHRTLPESELFSPWGQSEPVVPASWLSQVIISQVYHLGARLSPASAGEAAQPGGVDALRFLHALLVALRFLFLYLAFVRWTGSKLISYLGMLLALALSLNHLEVFRPQVFGELCMALMLFMVCRQPPTRLAAWMVPVLLVVWTNLHGSYLNGLLVLLGVLTSRMLLAIKASQSGMGGDAFHAPGVRRTFRMFYVSLIAIGILNPLMNFRWYTQTLTFAQNPNVRMMDEWQPLVWSSQQGILFAISLIIVAVTHLAAKRRKVGGISIGHGLLLICFGVQVVFFQRMLPWWAMLCPLVCVGPWARLLQKGMPYEEERTSRWLMQAIIVAMVCWVGFNWSTLGKLVMEKDATPLDRSLHPGTPRIVDLATRRNGTSLSPELSAALHKQGASIFCSETLGDYCLFAGNGDVIVYTHVHAFPEQHWRDCMAVKQGDANWEKLLNQWNTNVVCVEAELHPKLCDLLRRSPNWWIVLDEAGSSRKPNPKSRLFIAVRKSSIS